MTLRHSAYQTCHDGLDARNIPGIASTMSSVSMDHHAFCILELERSVSSHS